MKSQELRKKFFDFFMHNGHEKVASSSLIPAQDPTLLFANAGMNQFKDIFLGKEKRTYTRAVTIQKCVRAGGKHNDLDNVGFTQRHLTFFEMMGNFSFGDYFKREAIQFAWSFLTKEINLDPQKMYVSVHYTDQESYDIWHHDIGILEHKIFKLGEDNFWQMGDVGPCGPCTEIFVDRGSSFGCGSKDCSVACGCDRFLEVWNNVFMQFERQEDGTDIPLKQTGVDTGMGLERLAVIVQKKNSVFETDLFQSCFEKIEDLTGLKYDKVDGQIKAAFNVLGDHIRSATFLISDGCAPSNDGRGYVLRKIIRRAALFAQKLTDKNIFPELALTLIDYMKDAYPELVDHKDRIISVLTLEIERFVDNLIRGKRILQDYIDNAKNKNIEGTQAFMLYDTYGFPIEVTGLIAREQGFTVDKQGFEIYMEEQRRRSGKKMKQSETVIHFDASIATEFTGYTTLQEKSKILSIVVDDEFVDQVDAGQECWIVPAQTPFYVECGGQVSDEGTVAIYKKTTPLLDLKKIDQAILLKIKVPISIKVGDLITMHVDESGRKHIMKNHTATHLLQAGLQELFGKQVKQAGSLVTKDYLRFDYTYHQPLTEEQIKNIENLVNQKIWDNISVKVWDTNYKDAVKEGVIAFFGDKYNPDSVRAILIDNFSKELCGGTHVNATGDIGVFKIVEDVALAAGQRRIVAYTGGKALEEFQRDFGMIKQLCQDFKIKPDQVVLSIHSALDKIKELQRDMKQLKKDQWKQQIPVWINHIIKIGTTPYLCLVLNDYDANDFRDIAQALQVKQPGLYCFIQSNNTKSSFLISLDKTLIARVDLQNMKKLLEEQCGVRCGGNQTSLQGGGDVIDSVCFEKVIKKLL